MLSATAGESAAANAKDTSASAQTLSGISAVLSGTKTKALSTQGTLDIAGDINSIWATTDLASGATIANLTGESLYNAVHSQCVELVASQCESQSTLQMVISAYGMYIENDCTTLSNALDKKTTTASGTVRQTEHEMHTARLENYDAHNSTAINDCIAQVRSDITADTACGANYVHCLDISGKYLNRDTGAPIYTASFYELGGTISLSGDILNNQTNRLIVAELNRKRVFAARGLETCRDLADEVWDEFMRQAITEIYQGQQSRIRDVKNECLDVVTQCYDEQNESLKDFSNVKEQLLLGARMELSEEMCKEKLNACANLYGGGKTGMQELLIAMRQITDQSIAQSCYASLLDYAKSICAVPSTDSLHSYPYGCRTYRPGEKKYAALPQCLITQSSQTSSSEGFNVKPESVSTPYTCEAYMVFTSCDEGYFLARRDPQTDKWKYDTSDEPGNRCIKCPDGYTCAGDKEGPVKSSSISQQVDCGKFSGSLYQKIMRYARQTCVRPSLGDYDATPDTILQDANVVMDSIRVDMAKALATECERLGGTWVNTPWNDETDSKFNADRSTLKKFYTETSASMEWGFCADTAVDLAKSCTSSGGTWNAIESKCNCGSGNKYWDTINLRCKQKDPATACTMAKGSWDPDNKKCTCGTDTSGATWDETEYICKCGDGTAQWNGKECICNETGKTWFGGDEKKCKENTPTT